jgi:hypothetical protein
MVTGKRPARPTLKQRKYHARQLRATCLAGLCVIVRSRPGEVSSILRLGTPVARGNRAQITVLGAWHHSSHAVLD